MAITQSQYPVRAFVIVLLLAAGFSSLRAQDPLDTTGRWKSFNLNRHSGFLREGEVTLGLFFSSLDLGYYVVKNGTGGRYYRTTNGGLAWDTTLTAVPIPHRMFDELHGIAPDGNVTSDGGRSWKPLKVSFPDPSRNDSVMEAVAGSGSRIAVLYSAQRIDSPSVSYGRRLALTVSGGATWRFLDSTRIVADTFGTYISKSEQLLDTIAVGPLPYPEGTTGRKHSWLHLLWMNDSIVLVTSMLTGELAGGVPVSRTYLWTIDVATGKGRPVEVPRRQVTNDGTNTVGVIDDTTLYEIEHTSLPDAVTLWWSSDRGAHWDSIPAPRWLDFQSVRFLTSTFGIAKNGMTHDGGRTWTRWATPFSPQYFQAIDSVHFVGATSPSTFMRSSDAGRTWTINDAPIGITTILAQGADLLVARSYQSMLKSSDSGETIREVGRGGGLPQDLKQIDYMFYPDSSDHRHVVAIGEFVEYDATQGTSLLESHDGGETWKKGMALPELDRAATSFPWGGERTNRHDPVRPESRRSRTYRLSLS